MGNSRLSQQSRSGPSPQKSLSSPVFFRGMPDPTKIVSGTWEDVVAVWKRDGVLTLAAEGDTGMLLQRVARERQMLMLEVMEELERYKKEIAVAKQFSKLAAFAQASSRETVRSEDKPPDRWLEQLQEAMIPLSTSVSDMLADIKGIYKRVLGNVQSISGDVLTLNTFETDTGADSNTKIKDLAALKCLMDARSKRSLWSVRYASTQDAFVAVLAPFAKLLDMALCIKTESFLSSSRNAPKQIPHWEGTNKEIACIQHLDPHSRATEYLTRTDLEFVTGGGLIWGTGVNTSPHQDGSGRLTSDSIRLCFKLLLLH